ncbi:MAG: hypothetical protein GX267_07375 [Fibrobacter sp.]|jgi:hypothetical protein|nr:hypothetical protein [Fibrobacter sp.]
MRTRHVAVTVLISMVVFLFGCAGSNKYMKPAASGQDDPASFKLGEGEAGIVFMRPSTFGYKISSSVFEISENDETFAGIVSARKKVFYKTSAGEHLFMVIGESADFMKASLMAGKMYYALVTPRMGAMKARFSLKPVTKSELTSEQFKTWEKDCELTENTPESFNWAKKNSGSIKAKRAKYWPVWDGKADIDKPILQEEDCL